MEKTRLMTLDEVLLETKMGKTKLYGLMGEGRFPPNRPHGGNVVWVREEVDQWVDCLIKEIEYEYRKAA
ncbi:MAG: AlpA family phage regulatory protein [Methylotenera sp.]|uniref:helix-turn-helix transcriptional regulator n=1 Tax=Methylotenera sp. TaxID=2051956 RepID=UPI00271F1F01|nr:AlpA family phage regulatory protein [Methylotenera sp.]MDO9392967.1 AlpA family phage regulatory protein [Methylotenera sp.]